MVRNWLVCLKELLNLVDRAHASATMQRKNRSSNTAT